MSFISGFLGSQINCDVCGKNFKANLHEELSSDGGTLRVFTCPYCKTDYPVAFIRADGTVEDRRRHAN